MEVCCHQADHQGYVVKGIASGKDKNMREIKKKKYKLHKYQTKVLIKMKREKTENERDKRF